MGDSLMRRAGRAVRTYWLAALILGAGALLVLFISSRGASSGAIMISGATIGVLAGMAASAATSRNRVPAGKGRGRGRKR